MRVFKILLSSLLCVILLALCAFLPKLTATLQDYGNDKVLYGDMEPVSLEIWELTMLEKLGYFTDSSTVSIQIPDENAKTKREDLPAVIAKNMLLYQDVGLVSTEIEFADTDMWYMEASLTMSYNSYAPEKNALFWFINMSSSYYGESHLRLFLDDSTGAVLFIDFQTEEPSYSPNIPYSVLMRFYAVYFDGLGVPLEEVNAVELEPIDISETSAAFEFGWDGETFGRMIINFQVYEKGFFVGISPS